MYQEIRRIVSFLTAMNLDDIAVGWRYFLCFAVILIVLAGVYLYVHPLSPKGQSVDAKVFEVVKILSQMDTQLQRLRGAKDATPPPTSEAKDELGHLSETLQNKLLGIGLTFQSLRLFSEVRAEIETDRIAKTETFSNFRKNVMPELESLSFGYFWTTTPRRWIEIAWWAEFGTLVGLLFYIAGLLGTGLFRVEEISMFWTEVCITPLVVIVVFFLFSYTGITSIQPGEVSITVNLGFAFILGFAIRRTVGFLDIIKKRLLPEPEPAGKPAA